MIKAELKKLIGKKVVIYFNDNESQIYGTLGFVEEFFSEKYNYRKPGYFYIGDISFMASHVKKAVEKSEGIFYDL